MKASTQKPENRRALNLFEQQNFVRVLILEKYCAKINTEKAGKILSEQNKKMCETSRLK